tara:strand:+ start:3466 stop:3756 length:291 start_codon:yes stop_codon:yes gene_type:complete
MRNFFLGVVVTMMLLGGSLNSHETLRDIEAAEKMIDAWVHAKHCEVAIVKDIDLFDRKVLVKARGTYFVMTAWNSETFEICPIAKYKTADPKNWKP